MTKAVIFDFDGVIVQTADILFKGVKEALRNRGYKIDDRTSNYLVGTPRKEFINKFVRGISSKEVDQIIEDANKLYFKDIPNLRPLDGVEKLIDELNEKFVLVIASTGKRKLIDAVLKHLELSNKFKIILSEDDASHKKPDPEIYLKALEKLNFSNRDCVAIEDSTTGIEAARKAGIKCIALKHKKYPQDLSKADLIVNSLKEITIGTITKLGG